MTTHSYLNTLCVCSDEEGIREAIAQRCIGVYRLVIRRVLSTVVITANDKHSINRQLTPPKLCRDVCQRTLRLLIAE